MHNPTSKHMFHFIYSTSVYFIVYFQDSTVSRPPKSAQEVGRQRRPTSSAFFRLLCSDFLLIPNTGYAYWVYLLNIVYYHRWGSRGRPSRYQWLDLLIHVIHVYTLWVLLPILPPLVYYCQRDRGMGDQVLEHLYLYPYVHYESRDYYLPRYPQRGSNKIINNLPWIPLVLLYSGVPKRIPTYSPVPLLYGSTTIEGGTGGRETWNSGCCSIA